MEFSRQDSGVGSHSLLRGSPALQAPGRWHIPTTIYSIQVCICQTWSPSSSLPLPPISPLVTICLFSASVSLAFPFRLQRLSDHLFTGGLLSTVRAVSLGCLGLGLELPLLAQSLPLSPQASGAFELVVTTQCTCCHAKPVTRKGGSSRGSRAAWTSASGWSHVGDEAQGLVSGFGYRVQACARHHGSL